MIFAFEWGSTVGRSQLEYFVESALDFRYDMEEEDMAKLEVSREIHD